MSLPNPVTMRWRPRGGQQGSIPCCCPPSTPGQGSLLLEMSIPRVVPQHGASPSLARQATSPSPTKALFTPLLPDCSSAQNQGNSTRPVGSMHGEDVLGPGVGEGGHGHGHVRRGWRRVGTAGVETAVLRTRRPRTSSSCPPCRTSPRCSSSSRPHRGGLSPAGGMGTW